MVWSLFWTMIFLLFAGLAIDTSNAHRYKMVLQVTADASALGAAVAMAQPDKYADLTGNSASQTTAVQRGRATAVELATRNMRADHNGTVLQPADVRFGSYTNAGGFVVGSGDAVEVTTRRMASRNNEVPTFFLKLLNVLPSWDIRARSVAQRYNPPCVTNGIITLDVIDFQSNNTFSNDICLHGESGIEVNQNNTYLPGVRVSMPDRSLLTVPGGNMQHNTGLEQALVFGSMEPRLAMQVDAIITGLTDLSSPWQPDYITNNGAAQVFNVDESNFDPATMVAGNVYNVSCNGNGNNTLNLRGSGGGNASLNTLTNIQFTQGNGNGGGGNGGGNGGGGNGGGGNGGGNGGGGNGGGNGGGGGGGGATVIENVVIVTNCDVAFDQNTTIRNAMVATSSADARSVSGSSGVMLGDPDDCAPGGGAQIITAGGLHFAAKMEFHGSQLVSKGTVKMAAQVDGISGTSIESLGRVDMASNNTAGLCQGEADQVLETYYYRLVH